MASRRIVTLTTAGVVAVGALVPLAVSSRALAAKSEALAALERPEFRTIVVTDPDYAAGIGSLTTAIVAQLARLSSVEELVALGEVRDTRAAPGWPGGERIPTVDLLVTAAPEDSCDSARLAVGSPLTRAPTLHLATELAYIPVVGVRNAGGDPSAPPAFATLTRCSWDAAREVRLLLDRAGSIPHMVSVLVATGGGNLEVTVPSDLEALRRQVSAGLGSAATQLRNLAMVGAGLLVGGGTLTTSISQAKHFARRRALGAARSDILLIVIGQVVLTVLLGLVFGTVGYLLLTTTPRYVFDPSLAGAVGVGLLLMSLAASMPGALVAARREPGRVLRIA